VSACLEGASASGLEGVLETPEYSRQQTGFASWRGRVSGAILHFSSVHHFFASTPPLRNHLLLLPRCHLFFRYHHCLNSSATTCFYVQFLQLSSVPYANCTYSFYSFPPFHMLILRTVSTCFLRCLC
jgi:hypothetical protein